MTHFIEIKHVLELEDESYYTKTYNKVLFFQLYSAAFKFMNKILLLKEKR